MPNIALNGNAGFTPSASDFLTTGYEPDKAFDGNDIDTPRWCSLIEALPGKWLKCDFGSPKNITQFRLLQYSGGAAWATSFKIQSSTDNSAWTDRYTSGTVTIGALDSGLTDLTTPATARYWRVLCVTQDASSPSFWGVPTFELWEASGPAGQSLTLPFFQNQQAFYAGTLAQTGGTQAVLLPFFQNTQVFFTGFVRHPEDRTTGMRIRLWGSPVPFWCEELVDDDDPERKTYMMPFGVPSGGPGRRIVLPGVGTRVAFWIEEHPDHPGAYVFPIAGSEPMTLSTENLQNPTEILPGDIDSADESA